MVESPIHDSKSDGVCPVEQVEHRSASRSEFGRWLDPEWLLFEAFMFTPALLCALWGDADRAVFYSRLALHLGCLKWLGWAVLTRVLDQQLRFLMFPAELITGMALTVGWFYLRNVAGWLVPGSYSLIELRILAWLVMACHAAGAVLVRGESKRALVPSALMLRAWAYLPFACTVALTLWSVAKELSAPSQDGWLHAFMARVYLNDGLFDSRFNGGQTIFYVSGFAAINAATAALSGMTVVKVVNLQHILWAVVGCFMLTTTVALVARRPLVGIHSIPVLFLSAYPVHNLPPLLFWEHLGQQTAPALLLALPLLSLLLPTGRRSSFYIGLAVQALLALLVLALNPTCAVFLLLASIASLFINAYRGRRVGDGVLKVAGLQACFTLLSAILVLGSDRYYSTLIQDPGAARYVNQLNPGGDGSASARLISFSVRQALKTVGAVDTMTLIAWPPEFAALPGRHFAWLALLVTVAACGLVAAQGRSSLREGRQLAGVAAASIMGWLAAKYAALFFAGGLTQTSDESRWLYAYLFLLSGRLELWLLFFAALTAGVSIHLSPRNRGERRVAMTAVGSVLITLGIWWLPYAGTHLDPRANHLIPRNVGVSGKITSEDIELASWMERNLTLNTGPIGLASFLVVSGSNRWLYPNGPSQTLPLYGRKYDFTFLIFDPSRERSYDDYDQHVATFFDADWCLKNNIRYFHLPAGDSYPEYVVSYGLSRARQVGLLQPVRMVQSSGVYEVRPLPWTPRLLPFPATPARSHQINWTADSTGIAVGADPYVVFTLDAPQFVHAIRFKYTLSNAEQTPEAAQLFWSGPGEVFVEHERTARLRLELAPQEETLPILVHDTVKEFRFDPCTRPCTFRIRDIELLVKPDGIP